MLFSRRFSRTCLEGISFKFFVCFIFNVSLGSAPKRKKLWKKMYTIFAWLVTLFKPKASFAYLSIEAWQTAVVGSFPCKRKKWLFCCGGAMGRVLQTYIFPKRQVLNLTATITWNWRKSHFATLNYKQKKHRMLNFYVLTAASGFIQLKREACKKW